MEIKKRIKIDSQHCQPAQWHLNKNTERRNWILRMDGVMIQSEHWIARACSEVPPLETLLLLLLYTITFSTTEHQTNQSLNAMYIILSIWHWNHVQMINNRDDLVGWLILHKSMQFNLLEKQIQTQKTQIKIYNLVVQSIYICTSIMGFRQFLSYILIHICIQAVSMSLIP